MPVTPDLPARPPVVVPRGVEVAVAWTWRLVLLAGGVVLLGLALGRVLLLTAAFAAALLLTAVLHPLVVRVQHAGVPRRLAAAAVFLAFVAVVAVVLATLGAVVGAQLSDLMGSLSQAGDRLLRALQSSGLPVDQRQLDRLRGQSGAGLQGGVVSGAVTAVGTLLDLVTGAVLALFIVLVLLLDGRTVWGWVLRVLPRAARQPADEAGTAAWQALTGYMRGILVVALVDATLIAVALLLIGVPAVAPLAALTFLGAFLPYAGATIAGLAAVAVALVAEGPVAGSLVVGAVVLVQMVDGYVLEPLVLGKAVRLHPLAVVVVITLGGLLAGIGGAVVAVPLAGGLNAAVVHLRRQTLTPGAAVG
ncbi:MAG: AI-2E family transporter [Actinomycetota bacterium]|nr:AI-2E family transporter [Actinomycetota bacterium]